MLMSCDVLGWELQSMPGFNSGELCDFGAVLETVWVSLYATD